MQQLEEGKFPSLPFELVPSYNRTCIVDPNELETEQLNVWSTLEVLPASTPHPNAIQGMFVLSGEHVKLLREIVLNQLPNYKMIPDTCSLH